VRQFASAEFLAGSRRGWSRRLATMIYRPGSISAFGRIDHAPLSGVASRANRCRASRPGLAAAQNAGDESPHYNQPGNCLL